jgi:hypothetical protein
MTIEDKFNALAALVEELAAHERLAKRCRELRADTAQPAKGA